MAYEERPLVGNQGGKQWRNTRPVKSSYLDRSQKLEDKADAKALGSARAEIAAARRPALWQNRHIFSLVN
jgi:hypothetical protein